MSAVSRSTQESIDAAAARGLCWRAPAADELYIDIDSREQWKAFRKSIEILAKIPRWYGFSYLATRSPSKKPYHYHVVVKLARSVDDLTRIAMQLALGSDPARGLLDLERRSNGDVLPVLFFEEKRELEVVARYPFHMR